MYPSKHFLSLVRAWGLNIAHLLSHLKNIIHTCRKEWGRKNLHGFDFVPWTPRLVHLKWCNETGLLSHEVRVKEINGGANWYEKI